MTVCLRLAPAPGLKGSCTNAISVKQQIQGRSLPVFRKLDHGSSCRYKQMIKQDPLVQRAVTCWTYQWPLCKMQARQKNFIADVSPNQEESYHPLTISRTPVERVDIFRHLDVHTSSRLSWPCHINTLVISISVLHTLKRPKI